MLLGGFVKNAGQKQHHQRDQQDEAVQKSQKPMVLSFPI